MAPPRALVRVSFFCLLALSPIRYIAIAQRSSPGLKIVVIEGEGAVNVVQQRTAIAPVVEVRDRNDAPVAGATVRFAIRTGRALIGSGRTLTVTTNAAGRATAVGFSPTGTGAVQIVASASFQGQTAVVAIAQTNVATAAQAVAIATSSTASGAGGAAATGGVTAGGAAAGGTAAGASAAAGTATGGLSGTAIGVIGGAAVGGSVITAKVAGSDSGSDVTSTATYSGPFTLQLLVSFTPGVCNVPAATITYAQSGTLTMEVSTKSDGSVTGTATVTGTTTGTSAQCTLPNPGPNPFSRNAPVTGAPTSLSFRSEFTGASGQSPTSQTDTFTFTGTLDGGVIAGTFQHDHVVTLAGGGTIGSGSAAVPVLLQ